jgi:hypothetical protein
MRAAGAFTGIDGPVVRTPTANVQENEFLPHHLRISGVVMGLKSKVGWSLLCVVALIVPTVSAEEVGEALLGERLDAATFGPSVVETMDEVIARDIARRAAEEPVFGPAEAVKPAWLVPSIRATDFPHSGVHNVVNQWGGRRMGIGFGGPVEVRGAYFAGQGGSSLWTTGIRVIGYRGGAEIATTDWFRAIGEAPTWFAMNLVGVDRIVIEAEPARGDAGWYGMDDLTFLPGDAEAGAEPTIVDFEDSDYNVVLSGGSYAGLTWEFGEGGWQDTTGIHAPAEPPLAFNDFARVDLEGEDGGPLTGGGGTLPDLPIDYRGVIRGDAGQGSFPADTCGAIGPDDFVVIVNTVFAVYGKNSGVRRTAVSLSSFMPGSSGDPRVVYDQHSGRWFVVISNFRNRIFLAASRTGDPMGAWFKTSIPTSQGSDSGKWPDYPTLGVSEDGVFSAAYMVGGTNRMTLFAVDKAPLIADSPSLGTVTAFRELPWEGAIQPAHIYGHPGFAYFVSRRDGVSFRVRRLDGPMTNPTLRTIFNLQTPTSGEPPDVPTLGSGVPLDSVGTRLMNAVYRDGFVYTAHTVNVGGRAACRWYQINVSNRQLVTGTISSPTLHYFFPAIAVNACGDIGLGFSGGNADQYAACYYAGRSQEDPVGETSEPALLAAGRGPINLIDGVGRNRWGDYSLTSLDPTDERAMWTIQSYAEGNNIWGTWIGKLVPVKQDIPVFLGCVTGPGGGAEACCEASDLDDDGDVDVQDYAMFQQSLP